MKSIIPTQQDIDLSAAEKLSGAEKPRGKQPQAVSALEELIAERKRLEQYTQEQHNRLSRLRELFREEKAAAEKQLEEKRLEIERLNNVSGLKAEIESLRQQLQAPQAEIDRLKSEHQAALQQHQGEIAEIKTRHEEELAQLKVAQEQLRTQHQAELTQLKTAHAQLQTQHQAELVQVNTAHGQLRAQQDAELTQLGAERDAALMELQQVRAEHQQSQHQRVEGQQREQDDAQQLAKFETFKTEVQQREQLLLQELAEFERVLVQHQQREQKLGKELGDAIQRCAKLEEEGQQQEMDFIAERRTLKEERRLVEDKIRELQQRECAFRDQQERDKTRILADEKTQGVRTLEADVRERLGQERERLRREREELAQERAHLDRLRAALQATGPRPPVSGATTSAAPGVGSTAALPPGGQAPAPSSKATGRFRLPPLQRRPIPRAPVSGQPGAATQADIQLPRAPATPPTATTGSSAEIQLPGAPPTLPKPAISVTKLVQSGALRTIAFACTGCGQSLQAKEELVGQKITCPKCGQPVAIPSPSDLKRSKSPSSIPMPETDQAE